MLDRSGFEGFKVQLVCRAADVSARSFYRHFAGKEELLLALLQDETARAGRRLRETIAAAGDPAAEVVAWIRAIVGLADHPRLAARARLFSSQQPVIRRFPAEAVAAMRDLVAPLEEAIARGCDDGTFPWAEPAADALAIYELTGGLLTSALAGPPNPTPAEAAELASAFTLRALGRPAS